MVQYVVRNRTQVKTPAYPKDLRTWDHMIQYQATADDSHFSKLIFALNEFWKAGFHPQLCHQVAHSATIWWEKSNGQWRQ